MRWPHWPRDTSQHRSRYCVAVKRARSRLQRCCEVESAVPDESGDHRRQCPFGVIEHCLPCRQADQLVGWVFVGAWRPPRAARGQGAVAAASWQQLPVYQPRQAAAVAALARRLIDGVLHLRSGVMPHADQRLMQACDWINQHASAELRASEVAAVVHLSTSRFVHWFADAAGVSFGDYRRAQVMQRAGRALVTSAATVTEIARDLGFTTPAYFATAFKRYHGCSPSAWREHQRPAAES